MSQTLTALLSQLTDPIVRDLAWAIASPNLLRASSLAPENTWYERLVGEYQDRLLELDDNPTLLHHHCQSQRHLGFYFESLWHFFLLDHARFQVLAHNWQQVIDGTTLGAFDFIVWDQRLKRIEHWELAAKFYLISRPEQPFDSALGINTRDKLRRKHEHMLNHQLMLSQQPKVHLKLLAQGLLPQHTRLILKGRLYYPNGCQCFLDAQGERGTWGVESPSTAFVAQQKLGWLTGGRDSKTREKKQSYRDACGNWYVQVDQDWLNMAKG
ncbi:DUF1853 family protein [Oceanisphaera pacifica]|uniref:DUF1853 family protein n=1 Tax=Oceanisphaera pacifica TaxID=2818389 RepID=A0ABS3NES0_9GAMM|nr:DUF1853 family protein [Oceanisphaera pacifica]MBO1519040.1 DUF1853 family protein [Oceanisphaera pacifica]